MANRGVIKVSDFAGRNTEWKNSFKYVALALSSVMIRLLHRIPGTPISLNHTLSNILPKMH